MIFQYININSLCIPLNKPTLNLPNLLGRNQRTPKHLLRFLILKILHLAFFNLFNIGLLNLIDAGEAPLLQPDIDHHLELFCEFEESSGNLLELLEVGVLEIDALLVYIFVNY